jgi:hypothetical protein
MRTRPEKLNYEKAEWCSFKSPKIQKPQMDESPKIQKPQNQKPQNSKAPKFKSPKNSKAPKNMLISESSKQF